VTLRRRLAPPLLAALACLVALGALAALALGLHAVRVRDAAVLHGFVALDRPAVRPLVDVLVHLCDPVPYALAGLALVVIAVVRGRPWRAGAVAVLLVVTGATTQALKHGIAEPRVATLWLHDPIGAFSWPSGHATAAMTLALCAVLVAPRSLRPLTALAGGAFAVGVGYGVLVLGWHFPSDVLGGFLVAGLWASLAVAGLRLVEREAPAPAPRWQWAPAAVAGTLAAVVAAAALGSRSRQVAIYALERPSLVVAAVVIAALGVGIVALVGAAAETPGRAA
jgi:membrane-associated phospholipid phosphatase